MVDVPKHVREDIARWLLHEWMEWSGSADKADEICCKACLLSSDDIARLRREAGEVAGVNPVERGIISQADLDAAAARRVPLLLDFDRLIRYPEVAAFRASLPLKFVPAHAVDREPEPPTASGWRSLLNLWRDEAYGIGAAPMGHSETDPPTRQGDLEWMAWDAITADIAAGRLEVCALLYNDRVRSIHDLPKTGGLYQRTWATERQPVPPQEFLSQFQLPEDGPPQIENDPCSPRYTILWRLNDGPFNARWLDPWVRPGPMAPAPRHQKGKSVGRPPIFSDEELVAALSECPRVDYRGVDKFGNNDEHAEALRDLLAKKFPDREKITARTLRDSISRLRRTMA